MNQWAFVIAAYGAAAIATIALVAVAFWAMRRAEADLEAVKHRR